MSRRREIEAQVIRLIVTTREKFPHTIEWNDALRRVLWRYALPSQPKSNRLYRSIRMTTGRRKAVGED